MESKYNQSLLSTRRQELSARTIVLGGSGKTDRRIHTTHPGTHAANWSLSNTRLHTNVQNTGSWLPSPQEASSGPQSKETLSAVHWLSGSLGWYAGVLNNVRQHAQQETKLKTTNWRTRTHGN